jgi:hypothetical protein
LSNVFADELKKERFLRSDPMNISLKEDTIPFDTTNKRKPHKNYESAVMLKAGIMEEVPNNQASSHLAPTFVVIKACRSIKKDGWKALRAVTGLTGLNKEVQRQVCIFLDTEDFLRNIKATSRWFFKAYLAQGYW